MLPLPPDGIKGNWSRRQRYYVGDEISRRVVEILGRVGEIFWTRRRHISDSSAAFWSPRRDKIGRLGNKYTFVASKVSFFGEIFFQDDVYFTDSWITDLNLVPTTTYMHIYIVILA